MVMELEATTELRGPESHLGLTYTLTSVWTGQSVDDATTTLPALAYLNNPLEDCHIDYVNVNMKRASSTASPPMPWWVWDPSTAIASGHCTIATNTGFVNATFTAAYTDLERSYDYVLDANYTTSASIWWGTRLVNAYWQSSLWAMGSTNYTDIAFHGNTNTINWDSVSIKYNVVNETSIQSADMFDIVYFFLADFGGIANQPLTSVTEFYNNQSLAISAMMTEGRGFSRTFYSLILADLGQSELSNLVLDEDNLQYALQATDDSFRTKNNVWLPQHDNGLCARNVSVATSPVIRRAQQQDCDHFGRLAAPNSTSSATIYSQYACSVPVPRGSGNVALAVILADIVFLSTLWKLYGLVVGWYLRKHDRSADACPRCLEMNDVLPLSGSREGPALKVRPVGFSRAISGESSWSLLHP